MSKHVYESEEGYDLWAKQYDESLGYLSSFETGLFSSMLGDLKGKKVLDLGCGTGRTIVDLVYAGASDIVGVDVSDEMLKIAKKRHSSVEFVRASAYELPFEANTFDVVTATFLLVHLKDLRDAFDEVERVLKPGGFFLVTNINQRKAPSLKLKNGPEIVIKSYYHMPRKVLEALDGAFFKIDREEFVYEKKTWVNHIVKAHKI